jgi:tricorn protease
MRDNYLPLAARVTDRAKLSDLIAHMVVGELSALHIFVVGGDFREGTEQIKSAGLGAREPYFLTEMRMHEIDASKPG